ncbi:MAG TPA: hypothetical protein VF254_06420 [Gammaproteobacteria bacterium]
MTGHDTRIAAHASNAPRLNDRIEDMERRLGVERAQLVANAREYGGYVRRRLTTPTSLIFSASVGFIAAEVIEARSAVKREAAKHGATKAQQKSAARSVLGSLTQPMMSLFHIVSAGFLAKKASEVPSHEEVSTQL